MPVRYWTWVGLAAYAGWFKRVRHVLSLDILEQSVVWGNGNFLADRYPCLIPSFAANAGPDSGAFRATNDSADVLFLLGARPFVTTLASPDVVHRQTSKLVSIQEALNRTM